MLSELTIHNVAVIAEADICFQRGLNVFTGETGAGKSILIGAIGAVLGGRTSKDLIRTGAGSASVTALFTNIAAHTEKALSSLGFEIIEGEVLLSRELTPDGTACRINGHPVTVAMLRTAGSFLINTHGQQDNQMLASTDSHRGFLDAFGALEQIISKYRLRYDALCTLENRLATIETDENAKAQQMDLLHYQIDEIEAADLTDGEEEEMASRRRIIRNAAALTTLLSRSREIITGSEEVPGVLSLLDRATADLTQAGRVLRELQTAAERVEGFRCELDDLASQLRDSLDQL
ncbi:MAG: AAA family ATPase, partial [Oscillospiraceae bacterium]